MDLLDELQSLRYQPSRPRAGARPGVPPAGGAGGGAIDRAGDEKTGELPAMEQPKEVKATRGKKRTFEVESSESPPPKNASDSGFRELAGSAAAGIRGGAGGEQDLREEESSVFFGKQERSSVQKRSVPPGSPPSKARCKAGGSKGGSHWDKSATHAGGGSRRGSHWCDPERRIDGMPPEEVRRGGGGRGEGGGTSQDRTGGDGGAKGKLVRPRPSC